jgi:metallo-beta-lactamase class B
MTGWPRMHRAVVALAFAAVVSLAAGLTAAILQAADAPAPDRPFDDRAVINLGDRRVELLYPGPGHSPDNTTAHIADEHLLFGGCLIRAGDTDWIGNVADADLPAWPATVERLVNRYPDLAVVIPGHGRPGDAALLPHTIQLARDAR